MASNAREEGAAAAAILYAQSWDNTKSSTVTVAPVLVIPMSQVPLLTAMPVMDRFVQAAALPMARVLSVPPKPLA